MGKSIPRASCSKAVTRQASSPPMLHYALGMDFPIHTRNTWKILILWAMPEVRQTVAMLPVCVLPEVMLLLTGAVWCFVDQSLRPKEHGSLSELFHLLIQRSCLKQCMCSSYPFTLESQWSNLVLYRCGVRRSTVEQGLSQMNGASGLYTGSK